MLRLKPQIALSWLTSVAFLWFDVFLSGSVAFASCHLCVSLCFCRSLISARVSHCQSRPCSHLCFTPLLLYKQSLSPFICVWSLLTWWVRRCYVLSRILLLAQVSSNLVSLISLYSVNGCFVLPAFSCFRHSYLEHFRVCLSQVHFCFLCILFWIWLVSL